MKKKVFGGTKPSVSYLANVFNEHFVNIACNVKIRNSSVLIYRINNNFIFLDPLVEPELSSVFLQLMNRTSYDADGS